MGRTFLSRFKAPIEITEDSSLNISHQSNLAELIRRAKLIVWDEATMNNRFLLEA
jgi:ATP-dependent DNA helicase PIF1